MSGTKNSSIKRLSSLGMRVEAAMRPSCEMSTRRRLRVLIPEGEAVVMALLLLFISCSDDTDDDEEVAGMCCDPEETTAKGMEMAAPVAVVTPPVGNSVGAMGMAGAYASPLEVEEAGDEELDDRGLVLARCVVKVKRPSSVRCTR